MADKFTADKLAWLDRIMLDPEITHLDFRFCYWISSRCDRATRAATAFQDTIASALDVTPRGIQKSAQRLAEKGLVRITSRRGHGVKNSYAPVLSNPNRCSGLSEDTRTEELSNPNASSNKYEPPSVKASLVLSQFDSPEREGARATLLQDDFRLDDPTYNWAIDRLGSKEAVERSVSRFVNHFRQVTGDRSKSRNWQAKLRNWIDDDAHKATPDKSVHAATGRLVDRVASFSAPTDREWHDVLTTFVKLGHWTRHVAQFGPPPTSPECRVPERLLLHYGIKKEAAA